MCIDMAIFDEYTAEVRWDHVYICPLCSVPLRQADEVIGEDILFIYTDMR